LISPVILYFPPTVNETSIPPFAFFVVALLAIAPFTKPCGVAHSASVRSTVFPGAGAAGGGAVPGAAAATFQA
jgi:hypothetical protein